MKKYILVVAAFFILAGCALRNNFVQTERLSDDKIAMIKRGETGKDKVVAIFGTPENRLVIGDEETFFYKDENLNALWIRFGKDGKVDKVVVSTQR
ncbi:MAG: hypothetical protein KKC21_02155 [Nitrospinae bacterium]|nr:hypothetical protein [Nitrospinota bacterium]